MQLSAHHASRDYLMEERHLRAVFCKQEARYNVRLERALYAVSVTSLLLVLCLVALDMLGLPGIAYLWQLFISLCT